MIEALRVTLGWRLGLGQGSGKLDIDDRRLTAHEKGTVMTPSLPNPNKNPQTTLDEPVYLFTDKAIVPQKKQNGSPSSANDEARAACSASRSEIERVRSVFPWTD